MLYPEQMSLAQNKASEIDGGKESILELADTQPSAMAPESRNVAQFIADDLGLMLGCYGLK